MDGTLTQVLTGLYEAHREIDRLRAELAQRDQRIVELEQEGQRKISEFTDRLKAMEAIQQQNETS